jgi:hypothetical protein
VLDLVRRLLGLGPQPALEPEPESEPGSGLRERLAARIAQVHARLAAAAQDETAQTPSDVRESET